ncbi:SDR family NAD(P)-dependent oxidoreductase [Amycolatopsis sp. NPDC004368]
MAGVVGEYDGLHVLANNAGVEITGLVAGFDPAHVRKMLEVNVLGTALGAKHAFRAMRPGGAAGNGGAVASCPRRWATGWPMTSSTVPRT